MSRQGWECPKCKKVYSPDITECSDCSGQPNYVPIHIYPFPKYPIYPFPTWYRPYIIDVETTDNTTSSIYCNYAS